MNKVCGGCNESKSLTSFGKRKLNTGDGRLGSCKACVNKKNRDRHNPEKSRVDNLRHRFGMTAQQYDSLFIAQRGCCGICTLPATSFDRALAVDHCHTTGKIRGLLCDNCNRALGQLKDSVTNLQSAIVYLQKDISQSNVIPIDVVSSRYRIAKEP